MDRTTLGLSLNLSSEMIAAGRPNRPNRSMSPTHITIHNTSNDGAGADATAHSRFVTQTGYYTHNGKKQNVSWHYTVDDRRVVKHLPISEVGLHAGPGNAKSIGIEICMHKGIDQAAANDRAARLVAALMHDLGIPKDNIVTHEAWTKKKCPTLLRANFDAFVSAALAYFSAIETSGAENTDDPQMLITNEERAAIRDFIEDGIETIDPSILEAEDLHLGMLDLEAYNRGSGS